MADAVAASRIGAHTAPRSLVMLHGIYGRGRNLRAVAQRVVLERPDYACWLVDLPHHGESAAGEFGSTIAGLSRDVLAWAARAGVTPRALFGHSYGGKVALAVADQSRDQPLQIWIIDSTPETKEPSGSAWAMLDIVRTGPQRFSRREDAVTGLVERGVLQPVAQWMAQNLTTADGGLVWRLDFDVMERLLRDFFETDLWHVVESHPAPHEMHFVKASESSVITPAAVARLEAAGPHVHLHLRTGGHWIHAESPDVVAALLIEHLPRAR